MRGLYWMWFKDSVGIRIEDCGFTGHFAVCVRVYT